MSEATKQVSADHRVVFTPSGLSVGVESGANLLETAQDAGVAIRSICGGNGQCRQCWIEVSEGSHSKHGIEVHADNVTPTTEIEERVYKANPKYQGLRLACRTHIKGDLVIDVPERSQEHLAYISKTNEHRDFNVNSAIKLINCELAEATLDDNPSATENIIEQLADQGVSAQMSFNILSDLQNVIQEAKGKLTVALRDETEIVAVYPQFARDDEDGEPLQHVIVGGAVDIGSTTLALYLYDLTSGELLYETSAMNPQIRFGEDLMSRVSYVMMNKGGDVKLTEAVRTKLTDMVHQGCKKTRSGSQ